MPRPVDMEKRQAILDAATRAFIDRGYDGTSVDLVADLAGAARRTVYHQFKSKEGLFDAVAAHLWSGLMPHALPAIGRDADSRHHIHRLAEHIASFWAQPVARAFLRLAMTEGTRFPALLEGYFRHGKLPVFTAISRHLAQMARQGLLSACTARDPDLATRQLIGLINEPLLWPHFLGVPDAETVERDRLVDEAVSTFMARFGPKQ